MTKSDALKAPCPYQIGKMCIADGCPKWRWENICDGIAKLTKTGKGCEDSAISCHNCDYREGYCS